MSIRMGRKRKIGNGVVYISKDRRAKVRAYPCELPKPTFFSDAEIERMKHTPGSYQYRGGEANDA